MSILLDRQDKIRLLHVITDTQCFVFDPFKNRPQLKSKTSCEKITQNSKCAINERKNKNV